MVRRKIHRLSEDDASIRRARQKHVALIVLIRVLPYEIYFAALTQNCKGYYRFTEIVGCVNLWPERITAIGGENPRL